MRIEPEVLVPRALVVAFVAFLTNAVADEKVPKVANLTPSEAVEAMALPEGFRVTLFAGEPDVRQPNAFCVDDRGRLWVGENYTYSKHGWNPDDRDRILIFEDSNNDGQFDERKVFFDDFHFVSGIEVGFGGVWIGSPPNLLFIPDRDGDDKPDSDPVVVLDGWGRHDHHETLNSFHWGPDGWLYGCHGVSTRSRVGKPGTPDAERLPINAGIWRYHPTKDRFEVFAWGTNNPWGVDFDDHGQMLVSACHIGHLFHIVQGARNRRVTGAHFSRYIYQDISQVGDHRHIGLDGRPGGGAHGGVLIYHGNSFPESYRGKVLMGNVHHHGVYVDALERKGSGFVGRHDGEILNSNDPWFLGFNFRPSPDGSVFVLDWYDQQACHGQTPAGKETGRIYKISYGSGNAPPLDLNTKSILDLATAQLSSNEWIVRHARRILAERSAAGHDVSAAHRAFRAYLYQRLPVPQKLRALWALHASGGTDPWLLADLLDHENEYLRAWAIQLALEDRSPPPRMLTKLASLARHDPSPVVRLYLASALQRLHLHERWRIAEGLISHPEDATDHNLPLMIWFGIEPLVEADPVRALGLVARCEIRLVREFVSRRLTQTDGDGLDRLFGFLAQAEDVSSQLDLLHGIHAAFPGGGRGRLPPAWPTVFAQLSTSTNAEVRKAVQVLAVALGDPKAVDALRAVVLAPDESTERKREALDALLRRPPRELAPLLHDLVADGSLRDQALRALSSFEHQKTAPVILTHYARFSPEQRRVAIDTLAARPSTAMELLEAVEKSVVPSRDVSAAAARQLRSLGDERIAEKLGSVWGVVRDPTKDKSARIAEYKGRLGRDSLQGAQLGNGRLVYERTCGQCHRLFDSGGDAGPNLTGTNRADLDYLLENVVDPNATVGKDYRLTHVILKDGRLVSGLVHSEAKNAVTVKTTNGPVVVRRADVEKIQTTEISMMPEGLFDKLKEDEIRDLVAYLARNQQIPLPK